MKPRLGFAYVLCGLLMAAGPVRSQETTPTFRAAVDLELIDVLVLDEHRRPVRGLTAADFTVLDNGKPRPILALTEVDLGVVERSSPSLASVAPDDVASNVTDARRLVVLVFDNATMSRDPWTVGQAKDVGLAVVNGLGPEDQGAVVFTLDSRRAQEPTADRGRLRAAVETLAGGFAGMQAYEEDVGAATQTQLFEASLRTLSSVVDALGALRGMRKLVIYVGVGVPIDFDAGSTPMLSGALGLVGGEVQRGLIARHREILAHAARANVSIYAIDPGGLQASTQPSINPWSIEFLRTMSGETGGRAIINTNEPVAGVGEIFIENASYYVLGVQARGLESTGRTGRLDVRVNRPGVTVRARNLSVSPDALPPPARADALDRAVSGLVPTRQIPLRVALIPYSVRAVQEAPVVVVTTIVRPPSEARAASRFDLLTAVFDENHRTVRQVRQTAEVDVGPSTTRTDVNVLALVNLKPGRYRIRTAVKDAATGETGSVYTDVDVPDFRRETLSLSGLVLASGVATPRDPAIADLLRLVPTTNRRFQTTDRVLLQARVYQEVARRPQPVTVTVQIRDANGHRIESATETLAVDRFTNVHATTVAYGLPLASLVAGEYALTLVATSGEHSTTRSLRFVIE